MAILSNAPQGRAADLSIKMGKGIAFDASIRKGYQSSVTRFEHYEKRAAPEGTAPIFAVLRRIRS